MATYGWTTDTYAASYLADKVGADAWASLTSDQVRQYMMTAYRKLYADGRFTLSSYDDSTAPQAVKDAQVEYSWTLYQTGGAYSQRQSLRDEGVASFSIGNYSESFRGEKSSRFDRQSGFGYGPIVDDLIRPYFVLPKMTAFAKRDDDVAGETFITVSTEEEDL